MECEQFDAKHEENTLFTEPQKIKCEVKTEAEEYDNIHKDIDSFNPNAFIETKLETEETEAYENEQKNTEECNIPCKIIGRDLHKKNFAHPGRKPNLDDSYCCGYTTMEGTSSDDIAVQKEFVKILSDFPVIFTKSLLPEIKQKKADALKAITAKFNQVQSTSATEAQIQKKIFNIRARLKQKIDTKRTGNKKIILKDWERTLLDLMNADSNPAIARLKEAAPVGVPTLTRTSVGNEDAGMEIILDGPSSAASTSSQPVSKREQLNIFNETPETKNLSLSNLQRLVLLEQLTVLRLKRRKLERDERQYEESEESGLFDL